jgi:hypothetical protein
VTGRISALLSRRQARKDGKDIEWYALVVADGENFGRFKMGIETQHAGREKPGDFRSGTVELRIAIETLSHLRNLRQNGCRFRTMQRIVALRRRAPVCSIC